MNSVTEVAHKVKIKINGDAQKVSMSDICVAGGIVNAYKALLLAEKM